MHDIKWIRDNPDAFDRGAGAARAAGCSPAKLLALDEKRRAAILKAEQAQARRNAASKEIGEAKKNKDEARAQALMAEVAQLKDAMPALEAEEKKPRRGTERRARRDSEPAARPKCRTARTRTAMSSTITSARSATIRSRRSSISSWAKRSA